MPILAPDRSKGKIAGMIMQHINPSMADRMRTGAQDNFARMSQEQGEPQNDDTIDAGAMALRAMFSAMQDGDYNAAFRAFMSADEICDSIGEREGY